MFVTVILRLQFFGETKCFGKMRRHTPESMKLNVSFRTVAGFSLMAMLGRLQWSTGGLSSVFATIFTMQGVHLKDVWRSNIFHTVPTCQWLHLQISPTCPDVHVYGSDLYVCNLTEKPNVQKDAPEKLQDQGIWLSPEGDR